MQIARKFPHWSQISTFSSTTWWASTIPHFLNHTALSPSSTSLKWAALSTCRGLSGLVQPLCWLCNIDCIPVCPCILEQMTPLQLLTVTVRTVSGRALELELWPNYMSFFLCPLFCVWVNNASAHIHTHANQNLIQVCVANVRPSCDSLLYFNSNTTLL